MLDDPLAPAVGRRTLFQAGFFVQQIIPFLQHLTLYESIDFSFTQYLSRVMRTLDALVFDRHFLYLGINILSLAVDADNMAAALNLQLLTRFRYFNTEFASKPFLRFFCFPSLFLFLLKPLSL